MNSPVRIAHAYGNGRKSLRRALAAPIDFIETDIWFRGGEIFVRHGPRLGLLPLVADRRIPCHPLPSMSLPIWGGYYLRPDIKPLRLASVLDLVAGERRLLLDVKGDYPGSQVSAFADTLMRRIADDGAAAWLAVCGQFWPVLRRLRELTPDLEVRYSIETPVQWERLVAMVERDGKAPNVCIEHRFLSEGRAHFLRKHGIGAYCWTVDDPAAASRVVAMGADGIISNDLDLLSALGS
jgi:glycerophosphoryl diester phosphodiesterase